MKKTLAICTGTFFLAALSGCAAGDAIDRLVSAGDPAVQEQKETAPRVYMDELNGVLKDFDGSRVTLLHDPDTYTFDVSQADLECEDGMLAGAEISVIYEGQMGDDMDTSKVKVLKVADNYHKENDFKDQVIQGELQALTSNALTVKTKDQTITFPVTGTEQYYQGGIRKGSPVYVHYKGELTDTGDPKAPGAAHVKVTSVSDLEPLKVPAPTPTPKPSADNKDQKPEQQLRTVIRGINLNVLQTGIENSDVTLNIDMSKIPCHFSGGPAIGSHVTVTYTGNFNGTTLEGITVLGVTGEIPENLREHSISFTVSGEIAASTANTITLLTGDGVSLTFLTDGAANSSTGGLLSGSSVKITYNPADCRTANVYPCLKIEDA